jgi:hypothetical protein
MASRASTCTSQYHQRRLTQPNIVALFAYSQLNGLHLSVTSYPLKDTDVPYVDTNIFIEKKMIKGLFPVALPTAIVVRILKAANNFRNRIGVQLYYVHFSI